MAIRTTRMTTTRRQSNLELGGHQQTTINRRPSTGEHQQATINKQPFFNYMFRHQQAAIFAPLSHLPRLWMISCGRFRFRFYLLDQIFCLNSKATHPN